MSSKGLVIGGGGVCVHDVVTVCGFVCVYLCVHVVTVWVCLDVG